MAFGTPYTTLTEKGGSSMLENDQSLSINPDSFILYYDFECLSGYVTAGSAG